MLVMALTFSLDVLNDRLWFLWAIDSNPGFSMIRVADFIHICFLILWLRASLLKKLTVCI